MSNFQRSVLPIWVAAALVLTFALVIFVYTLNITSLDDKIVLGQQVATSTAIAHINEDATAQAIQNATAFADPNDPDALEKAKLTATALIATVNTIKTATAFADLSNTDKTATRQAGLTATVRTNKSATARAIENATAFAVPNDPDALEKAKTTAIAQKKLIATVDAMRTATAFAKLSNADKTATIQSIITKARLTATMQGESIATVNTIITATALTDKTTTTPQVNRTATVQSATSTKPIAATSTELITSASKTNAPSPTPVVLANSVAYAAFMASEGSELTGDIETPNTGGTSPAPFAMFILLALGAILVSTPFILPRWFNTTIKSNMRT